MNIDPATIVVIVLTVTAGVFLIAIEIHSRRNPQLQQAEMPPPADGAAESARPVAAAEVPARKKKRRRK